MKRNSPCLTTIVLLLVACDSSPSDPVDPTGTPIHEPLLLEGPSSRFFGVEPVGDEWLVGTGSISARNDPGLFAFHRPTNTFRELEPVSGAFRVFGEEVYAIAADSSELQRHELRGTDSRKLSDPAHTVSRFWISPDGGHIAYLARPTLSSARAELFVVPTGGGAVVQVSRASAEGEVIANSSDRNGMATIPRFAGDRLLYASEFDGDDDRWELVSVRFDGSGVVRLNGDLGETATVRAGRGSEGFSFVVSPDGAEVIYASNEASAGGSELYRIAPDGTGRQRLHESVGETGGYTFGSARFHYVAGYLSDGTLLFAIDLDGNGLRLFRRETSGTVQRLAGDTVFSPLHFPEELPGDELLVVTHRGIERAPLNGDAPTLLASTEEYSRLSGQTNTPALTADGSHVVFMARVTGTSYENLYVVPFAGGETRRVSDLPEDDQSSRGVISSGTGRRSFLLSPDGRSVAYLYQGDSSAIQVRWSELDGTETRVVTPERQNVGLGSSTTGLIAFDREIVFANDDRRWTESLLYAYDPQTDVRVALEEHFPAFVSEDIEGWVQVAESGRLVMLTRDSSGTGRLISTAPDGTNPVVIDEGSPSAADVLGDQVVYRFQEESGASSLRMANADGVETPTTLFEIPAEGDQTLWGVLPVPSQTGSPTQVLLLLFATDEIELWSSDLVTGETVELATTERVILSESRIFVTPTRIFAQQTLPRGAGSRIVGIDLNSGEVDVIVSGEFDRRSIGLYAVANNGTQLQFSGDFDRVGVVELFDVPIP